MRKPWLRNVAQPGPRAGRTRRGCGSTGRVTAGRRAVCKLIVERLENRCLPSASLVYAGYVPATRILDISEFAAAAPSPNGVGTSLTITGNTRPNFSTDSGLTTLITVTGGPGTTVDEVAACTFTIAYPGAIAAINVNLLNDNTSLTIGTPTGGVLNLPSTQLNVTVGSGNDTFVMGTAGSATVPAVNNVLHDVTWTAANHDSTGTEFVSIQNAKTVGSIAITQNSGPRDSIQLWGVSAPGGATLTQNQGAGDTISIDQLNRTNATALVPSSLGSLRTSQGDGGSANTTVNRTLIVGSYQGSQGNGSSDGLYLGDGDSVGPVTLTQGSGNGDYLGLSNVKAGVATVVQHDLATNLVGDTLGGVTTPAVPSAGTSLDSPSTAATANLVTANNTVTTLRTAVPTSGLAGAALQQLSITQGSAPGDVVALVQLPAGAASMGLSVTGTLAITQQDLAFAAPDFIFLGSYLPSGSPPFKPASAGGTVSIIGSITAANEVVTQGNATADVLSVLFNQATASPSQFTQGNGGDEAVFQEDTATGSGQLNYQGGSGGNHVQADSNNAAGTIHGGFSNAANNHLVWDGQAQNPSLSFMDFGNVTPG